MQEDLTERTEGDETAVIGEVGYRDVPTHKSIFIRYNNMLFIHFVSSGIIPAFSIAIQYTYTIICFLYTQYLVASSPPLVTQVRKEGPTNII